MAQKSGETATLQWKKLFRQMVQKNFQSIQSRNPRFSVRGYAKKLGLSPSCTWDILKNKKANWSLSLDRAYEITQSMVVDNADQRALNQLLIAMGKSPKVQSKKMDQWTQATLLDGEADLVLMFFDLPGPQPKEETIAAKTGIPVQRVTELVASFKSSGLLVNKKGRWLGSEVMLEADLEQDGGKAIREYHRKHLALARKAIDLIPRENRHFSTLTFNSNPKKMKLIAERIEQLINEVDLVTDLGPNDAVYRIGVSLFPIDFTEKK